MLTATGPAAFRQHARMSAISTEQFSKRRGNTVVYDTVA
jgi:hypothetical protein